MIVVPEHEISRTPNRMVQELRRTTRKKKAIHRLILYRDSHSQDVSFTHHSNFKTLTELKTQLWMIGINHSSYRLRIAIRNRCSPYHRSTDLCPGPQAVLSRQKL